jgi:hypothetical protein
MPASSATAIDWSKPIEVTSMLGKFDEDVLRAPAPSLI